MLLLIDNYDSFTYNLVHYFQDLDQDVMVVKHDHILPDDIKLLSPNFIVISPGPKDPSDAGSSVEIIREYYQSIPILGVCLGHQCLGVAFGGAIIRAPEIIHGKTSLISHHRRGLFKNIPSPFHATRYHSLVIDPNTLPTCFRIDAWVDKTIMAIKHNSYPVFGVQFHPESILTEYGYVILKNFLSTCAKIKQ